MSKPNPITYYYPSRKKSIQKPTHKKVSDISEYSKFLECDKIKLTIPPNKGYLPATPFRPNASSTWIYPGSKGFRKYQFFICRSSLFFNTLVCLPTGLGKTFIAATVMYNYYRWFKEGLIFFLAPTKPLVDQQYNAFMEIIIGFNESHIGQLTGKQNKKERRKAYTTARIFFMTPQTLANDLKNGLLDKQKVTCIVFDEAHRATGNYAYGVIVKELMEAKIGYRVLALSATPGPNIESIQQIIENLCIVRVEVRSEEDPDVKPYTHFKNIELIRVKKTSEIVKLEEFLIKVINIPQSFLQKLHVLPYTKSNKPLNKMVILEAQEKYKRGSFGQTRAESKMIYSSFSSLLSLLCGLSMLLTHGIESLRVFCEKFSDSAEEKKGRKPLVNSKEYKELMNYLEDINKAKKNHPKLEKMKELLIEFFSDKTRKDSQVIVFTLFVNSAQEICKYLESEEIIKPKIFIGQANGYTQKDQMRIINEFKAHKFNTLVATCIGEEGLDIGYVDLIVSYDCTGSPVRMIQRFGRTGRKKEGKVVILLCDDEEKRYNKMQKMSKSIYGILKQSTTTEKSAFSFFEYNPNMIEEGVEPVCIYATKKEDFINPKTSIIVNHTINKENTDSGNKSINKSKKRVSLINEEVEESKIPITTTKEINEGYIEERISIVEDLDLDKLLKETKDDLGNLSEEVLDKHLGDLLKDKNVLCDDNISEELLALADDILLDGSSKFTRPSEADNKYSKRLKLA